MAVNNSRSMSAEFQRGIIEPGIIQLAPDRAAVENPPVERLSWPTYQQVEDHAHDPFPHKTAYHEVKTSGTPTQRATRRD